MANTNTGSHSHLPKFHRSDVQVVQEKCESAHKYDWCAINIDSSCLISITTHASPTRDGLENVIFCSVYSKTFVSNFFGRYAWKKLVFHDRTSVHKNFKNHFYPGPTRFPGPQTRCCHGEDLSHFRHGNLTPDWGTKCRNKSTKLTKSCYGSNTSRYFNCEPPHLKDDLDYKC